MMRILRIGIWVLAAAALAVSGAADAKLPIKKSSGGYSKPAPAKPAETSPADSAAKPTNGYAKPASPPQGAAAQTPPPRNATDQALAAKDSKAAFAQFQSQHQAFKQPATSVPQIPPGSSFASMQRQPASQVYVVREHYYGGWGLPPYAYYAAPHYGMWDTFFLFFLLSHITQPGYGAFYYHHYDDPGMADFRHQLDQQAQQNSELKQQVQALQAQVDTMKGQPRDPNYLPPETPAEAALTTQLTAQEAAPAPIAQAACPPGYGRTAEGKCLAVTPERHGPEPATVLLIAAGLGAVGFGAFRLLRAGR